MFGAEYYQFIISLFIQQQNNTNTVTNVRDRDLGPKDHQLKMDHRESNGHVTDDIRWPWKVKVVTPIHIEANISETAEESDLVTMERL